MRVWLSFLLTFFLLGCGNTAGSEAVQVALIGDGAEMRKEGVRLSNAAQLLRAATGEGLVAFGPTGEIVPAIAERWIVTDDGLSYIFRLRNSTWPSGDAIAGGEIRVQLLSRIEALKGTSLGYDLSKVTQIRQMTGRVIEIRLASPMPEFLRVLAQPELGFSKDGTGVGPMLISDDDGSGPITLSATSPEQRGFPTPRDWEDSVRPVSVQALSASDAVDAFSSGQADLVLGGRVADFPLADLGPLSRGNIRMDATQGMFGLIVRSEKGLLAQPEMRHALAMAIDRGALIQPFNLSGWEASTSIVPLPLWTELGPEAPAWTRLELDQRRQLARQRVAEWVRSNGGDPTVSIGLPPGPGSEKLFTQLASDFALIGVDAKRMAKGKGAELELHDRVARFNAPRWYLNQLHCEIRSGPCSPSADQYVAESISETNADRKAELLARAALSLQEEGVFIALGAPIRWSLVRSDIEAFQENAWSLHPLFSLSGAQI